jgi:hypothetical protein
MFGWLYKLIEKSIEKRVINAYMASALRMLRRLR